MNVDIENRKQELQVQLDELKHEFKMVIPKKIAEAAALGDLKENADYHAARERQGFVKAKIAQITAEINKLNSINVDDVAKDRVGYGSKVEIVEPESGFTMDLSFVADGEADPSAGKITLNTPYGVALAGKAIGEEVEVNTPMGVKKFIIKKLITIHGEEFLHEI